MNKDFYTAIKDRRSYYGIGNEKIVSEERIEEIVKEAVTISPTAFNCQGSKVVVLFGSHHEKLWEITKETLRKIVPAEVFGSTEAKINSFKSGYGTILYFEDDVTIQTLQEQFALYKDNFPVWAEQSNGMLQYIIWTALEVEGLGASLQHYNPLIDEEVKSTWNIPTNWRLIAQMPFGAPTATPDQKNRLPLDQMMKVFK